MSRHLYEELANVKELTNQSLTELLWVAVDKAYNDLSNAYEQGYDEGKAEVMEALREIEFMPTCPRCGFASGVHVSLEEKD